MLYVQTERSRYEIDTYNNRVRRVSGDDNPTPRQGEDGVWKDYVEISKAGPCLLFHWDDEGRGTMTSPVVHESTEALW